MIFPINHSDPETGRPAKLLRQLSLGLLLFFANSYALIADSDSQLRAQVGLKLFRTMMSANLDAKNNVDRQGVLHVLLVYANDYNQAKSLAEELSQGLTTIQGLPVEISPISISELEQYQQAKPQGAFITQRLTHDELQRVIRLSINRHILLFSPFEGDVEQGVLGGLSVESAVRPFINMQTLNQSGVRIKPFYLKVAKQYE